VNVPIDDRLIDAAARLISGAKKLAVLSGAGISAESGVPTFRGSDGLWEGHRIEEVATPHAFRQDPALVWRFYNQRRANLTTIQPNPGHHALADLERRQFPDGRFTLITQNVDGLHHAAGSERVLELHGNLRRTRCSRCELVADQGLVPLEERPICLECGGLLRPDIVWFGEMLPPTIWEQAAIATATCDAFLVVGTSAVVYPAAGLISAAKQAGAAIIEVNLTETEASELADIALHGPSGEILPQLARRLQSSN